MLCDIPFDTLSDDAVRHLSHTSGLSREQRGLGRPKLVQR